MAQIPRRFIDNASLPEQSWRQTTLCSHSSHEWFNGGFKVERPSGAAGHGQVIRSLDPLVVDVQEPQLAVVPAGTLGEFQAARFIDQYRADVRLHYGFPFPAQQVWLSVCSLPTHERARLMKARLRSVIERVTWPLPLTSSQ